MGKLAPACWDDAIYEILAVNLCLEEKVWKGQGAVFCLYLPFPVLNAGDLPPKCLEIEDEGTVFREDHAINLPVCDKNPGEEVHRLRGILFPEYLDYLTKLAEFMLVFYLLPTEKPDAHCPSLTPLILPGCIRSI